MAIEFPEGVTSTLKYTQNQQIKKLNPRTLVTKESTWHPQEIGNIECKEPWLG